MTTNLVFAGSILLAILLADVQNAWATPLTVGKLHNYCLELPNAQDASPDVKGVKAVMDSMYLQGYIAGVTDEMNDLADVGADFDWPKTNGELVDAVCQYFTLHPEQWSWEAAVACIWRQPPCTRRRASERGEAPMNKILHGMLKTFYRTGDDPRLRPNRYLAIALFDCQGGSFELVEREGDTVPEPFCGEDEVASSFISNQQGAKNEFDKRCQEIVSAGWREYRGE